MKWLKNKTDQVANSYWDTISDVMSTLLLVLMLVMVLLILYVVRAPKDSNQESIPESEVIVEDGVEEQYVEREAGHKVVTVDVPYWLPGIEDEEYGRGEEVGDFLYEDGGFGEGEFDGHEGAAVKVIVEDAETHAPIREEGIKFGLYSSEGRRLTMKTYYPNAVTWLSYETAPSGIFYLPQKVPLAEYTLHALTAPAGYTIAEDTTFTLEEPHSWNEPYVVHIPLNSVRNTIHLTAVDSRTGDPVPGGVFDILAAENITTADGTVRYAEGSVVEQITADEEGTCRSTPLYLGSYLIAQSAAPDYYAVTKETYPITLTEEASAEGIAAEQRIPCDKTRYTLNVVDELYPGVNVPDAEFTLLNNGQPVGEKLTTDAEGGILLDALDKQTEYTLTQTAAPEGYQMYAKDISFFVDENGRIDNDSSYKEEITNRTLRLSVIVEDVLFHNPVSGCRATLYNEANQPVKVWNTSDVATIVQGMPAGQYRLEITGSVKVSQTVQIEDTAQVQQTECSGWTSGNIVMVGGSTGGVGVAGVGAGLLAKRRKRRK